MRMMAIASAIIMSAAAVGTAAPALAASPSELRREATHLVAKAGELKKLVHAYHRGGNNAAALDRAAHEFHDVAKHMLTHTVRHPGDDAGLREDIRRAERVFATLEHLTYRVQSEQSRLHGGRDPGANRMRQVLNETSVCLNEFSELVMPRHYHGSPRQGFDHGGGRHDHRSRADRGGSTIRLGNSNIAIRFNW